jgi:predicted  nucleic acid-binding Zn-ribbon protein
MNLVSIRQAVTRKLHNIAVTLHIDALNAEVKAAKKVAVTAEKTADFVSRRVDDLLVAETLSKEAMHEAQRFAKETETKVQAELNKIGGTL